MEIARRAFPTYADTYKALPNERPEVARQRAAGCSAERKHFALWPEAATAIMLFVAAGGVSEEALLAGWPTPGQAIIPIWYSACAA
jgi:hypothetical protein